MAQKSLSISSGFIRLAQLFALPASGKMEFEKTAGQPYSPQPPHAEPVFPIWPDIPNRAVKPQERMQADLARMRRLTSKW